MLVREAFCLKVEQKPAIRDGHVLDGVLWLLFGFDTWAPKAASLNAFSREEIWHVCLIAVVKDIRKANEIITGQNICEAFNIFRVFRPECSHRYRDWLRNCLDFRWSPCVSCVLHDHHSEIVWNSNATSVNGNSSQIEAIHDRVIREQSHQRFWNSHCSLPPSGAQLRLVCQTIWHTWVIHRHIWYN